jgi:hypothetical protein
MNAPASCRAPFSYAPSASATGKALVLAAAAHNPHPLNNIALQQIDIDS